MRQMRHLFLSLACWLSTCLTAPPAAAAPAVAEHLGAAIRYRTISYDDPARLEGAPFLEFHDFLARAYPRVHQAMRREIVNNYSLLYTWEGRETGLKPVLLLAHIDVVPVLAGQEAEWKHPPFAGTVTDEFVWGRGAMDDKGSLIAIMEAAETLLAAGFAPDRTVYLAFGHDEEVGGPNGAGRIARLLEERGVRLEFTLDEGMSVVYGGVIPDVEQPVALIGTAEKGYLTVRLTAHAAGGHSSLPPPDSAIGRLARAVARLEARQMPARLTGPVAGMFDTVGPLMGLPSRVLVNNRWLFGRLLLNRLAGTTAGNAVVRTTTAVTMIDGGVKENVLPSTATATVNFRLLPGDTAADVLGHVERTIADPEIAIAREDGGEASPVADATSSSFALLRDVLRDVMPDLAAVAPALVPGGTDSKHYAHLAENSYRFVPLRLAPKDLARAHGVDERLGITTLATAVEFYAGLMRRAAGPAGATTP